VPTCAARPRTHLLQLWCSSGDKQRMPTMLPFAAWLCVSGSFAERVGDVVPAPGVAEGLGLQVLPTQTQAAEAMTVYLAFDGPLVVHGQLDDSHTNTTFIEQAAVDYAPYGDATQRAALVQAVTADWSPYAVTLTEARPAAGDYVMTVVSPTNPFAGQAAGIAPLDCGDSWTRNNVVFAFHGANDGYSINEQARTIGQEVAHSIGLEHTTEPTDIMSYAYGPADFWFVDDCMDILTTPQSPSIFCGWQHELYCPEDQQNSHAELLGLIGASTPDTQSPVLAIVAPVDGQEFAAGDSFEIVVEGSDDVAIVEMELFSGGTSVAVDGSAPWGWEVHQIPAGHYELYAEARDAAGNAAQSAVVEIHAVAGGGSDDGPSDADDGAPTDDDDDDDDATDGGDVEGGGTSDGDAPADDGSADDGEPAADGGGDEVGGSYAHEITDTIGCRVGHRGDRLALGALLLLTRRRRRAAR
jgi:hypothetical protein